jgi:hypothetical protein
MNARGRSRAAAAAIPIWGWLAIIYVLSVAFRFALAERVAAPWVFQDELVYSDLARSLADTGHFAIRDVQGTNGFGPLYPALIAPAWVIFASPVKAYGAAKLINALLMSLAALPTYVIARRLMRPQLALVAAVFAVAIPSLAYTTTLLSENAFYPAVMAAAAALFLLLERPTLLRLGAFLLFTVAACLVRAQGVTLIAALVIAIVAVALANGWDRWPRPRTVGRELLRYWVPLATVAAGVLIVWIYEVARGRPLKAVLGSSAGVTELNRPPGPTLRWTVHHFGEFDLYLGVIPFVAMVVMVGFGLRPREPSRELRAFAAASVGLVVVFVLTASLYAVSVQGQRIEERYMFHVAPLFFVALLAWIERGLPRPLALMAIAVALGAGLAALVPYDRLLTSDVVHDAFALVPLLTQELNGRISPASVSAFVGVFAILGASLAAVVSPRRAWVLVAAVLVYYGWVDLRPVHREIVQASRDAIGAGITVRKDWVDQHVGGDAHVALLTYARATALPYLENEFFNRSVRKLYTVSGQYDSLPRTDVAPRATGVLYDVNGKPVSAPYVLADYQERPVGRVIARDPGTGMGLYAAAHPLRLRSRIDGIYLDRWSGPEALYTQWGCRGGTVRAHVLSDPGMYHGGVQTLTALVGNSNRVLGTTTIRTTRPATFTVSLPPNVPVCAVKYRVTPTTVPAQVFPGNGDTRTLGIRFLRFDYVPAR